MFSNDAVKIVAQKKVFEDANFPTLELKIKLLSFLDLLFKCLSIFGAVPGNDCGFVDNCLWYILNLDVVVVELLKLYAPDFICT